MKLKYKLNFARRESTKHIKKIGAVLGSAALAGVLTMTGLFREYVSMRPLFSISINETEDKNLNREIDIFNTGGAVENLKLSDATVQLDLLVAVSGITKQRESHIRIEFNDLIDKMGKDSNKTSLYITEKNMEYLPFFLNTLSNELEKEGYSIVSYAIKEYYSIEYSIFLGRRVHKIMIPDRNANYYFYDPESEFVRGNGDVRYVNVNKYLEAEITTSIGWMEGKPLHECWKAEGENIPYYVVDSSDMFQTMVEGIKYNFGRNYVEEKYDDTGVLEGIPFGIADNIEDIITDDNGLACGYKVPLKNRSGQ